MMTLQRMLDNVTALSLDLPSAIPAIVQQTSYEIEVLNKQQLYNYGVKRTAEGVSAKADKLPQYKNKYYAREKNYMNPRPGYGVPDLFVTGAFYAGFTVTVTKKTFTVDSVNTKAEGIKKQYGEEIFGLTKNNIKVYAYGVFYKELQKYVELKTSLILR